MRYLHNEMLSPEISSARDKTQEGVSSAGRSKLSSPVQVTRQEVKNLPQEAVTIKRFRLCATWWTLD